METGWFNIYKKNDYQEFHDHGEHSLSAVYFLKSDPKKDAKLIFKNPIPNSYNMPEYTFINFIQLSIISFDFISISTGSIELFKNSLIIS
jgi:hypothetical protein